MVDHNRSATTGPILVVLFVVFAVAGCTSFDGIYDVAAAPPHVLIESGRGGDPNIYPCDSSQECSDLQEVPRAERQHIDTPEGLDIYESAGSTGVDGDVCRGDRTVADWDRTDVGFLLTATTSRLEIPKSEAGVPGDVVWGWSEECLDALDARPDSDFECVGILVLEGTLRE